MAIDPKRVADKLRHKLKRNFRGTQAFWFAVIEELFSEIEAEFGTGAGGNTAHVTRRQLIHNRNSHRVCPWTD